MLCFVLRFAPIALDPSHHPTITITSCPSHPNPQAKANLRHAGARADFVLSDGWHHIRAPPTTNMDADADAGTETDADEDDKFDLIVSNPPVHAGLADDMGVLGALDGPPLGPFGRPLGPQ